MTYLNLPRRGKWTTHQLLRRYRTLHAGGFTPEEAWDIAMWPQDLTHFVIRGMWNDRRRLLANWRAEGMKEAEIEERLTRRYVSLGIVGLYEDEEWYISRIPATV